MKHGRRTEERLVIAGDVRVTLKPEHYKHHQGSTHPLTMDGIMTCYKFVTDDRDPVMIMHQNICYPPANPANVDQVDTSYPGIVLKYENGYLLEDGVHRIANCRNRESLNHYFML